MEELPTRAEGRIEELKEAYIDDEISEQTFETLLDAAFEDDAPFRADWFMKQLETRRKRYAEETIYMYCGEEYKVEGEIVVPADSDEIERVFNVTGGGIPDEEEIEDVDNEVEISEEAKEKQDEIRDAILGQ